MPCNFISRKAKDAPKVTYKNPLVLIQLRLAGVSEMLIKIYC